MTSIRTLTQEETKEDVKFGIEIEQFYMMYHYKGKVYEITEDNLKDLYAIYLIGIND